MTNKVKKMLIKIKKINNYLKNKMDRIFLDIFKKKISF